MFLIIAFCYKSSTHEELLDNPLSANLTKMVRHSNNSPAAGLALKGIRIVQPLYTYRTSIFFLQLIFKVGGYSALV